MMMRLGKELSYAVVFPVSLVLSAFLSTSGFCSEYLYCANPDDRTITQVSLETGAITVIMRSSDGLTGPLEIAVDATGNLYVSNVYRSRILQRSKDGIINTYIDDPVKLTNIQGMDFRPDGDLFVLNDRIIYQYNTETQVLDLFDDLSVRFPTFYNARDIEFDREGNLYVASGVNAQGQGAVVKYSVSGGVTIFENYLQNPYSLAADMLGNLYVANRVGKTVDRFDLADGSGQVFANLRYAFGDPRAVVTDLAGRVYLLNSYGDIRRWNADGSGGEIVLHSGSLFSENLEFYSTIPEPASLVFMGLGMAFACKRRRQR